MNIRQINTLGIGLGPANLALAAVIEEQRRLSNYQSNSLFLEKNPCFDWHSSMLLPGAKLQVPFLRDLATLRDPQSPFTFLNYLKEKNRLDDFINLRTFYPTRIEFHDYLAWVCSQLNHLAQFNSDVISIDPIVNKSGEIKQLKVIYLDKKKQMKQTYITNNVILGIGKKPHYPNFIKHADQRIIHTCHLLPNLLNQFPEKVKEYYFVVIGSGQSAGEAVLYLLENYKNARVYWCFRNFTLHEVDNSSYVNQMYHEKSVDYLYSLGIASRQKALAELSNSNYSVIDQEILKTLTDVQYQDSLNGKERLIIQFGTEIKSVVALASKRLTVTIESLFEDQNNHINVDGIVLATGFERNKKIELLGNLEAYIKKDGDDQYVVSRNYKVLGKPRFKAGVYLQGYCESSHGPSEPTLAILATRAENIFNSLKMNSKFSKLSISTNKFVDGETICA